MADSITTINEALQYNDDHGLYSTDANCRRIYATLSGGGVFDGQRVGIKTRYNLDAHLAAGYTLTDVEVITTAEAFNQLINKAA